MGDFSRAKDSSFWSGLDRSDRSEGPVCPVGARTVRPLDRILRVCGDLDIPELGPDSPDLGVRILREYVWILRIFVIESLTGQIDLTGLVYRSDRC